MDMAEGRVGKTGAGQAALIEREMGRIAAVGQKHMDAGIVRGLDPV